MAEEHALVLERIKQNAERKRKKAKIAPPRFVPPKLGDAYMHDESSVGNGGAHALSGFNGFQGNVQ